MSGRVELRIGLHFLGAIVAASLASGVATVLLSLFFGFEDSAIMTPAALVLGIGIASLVSAPVVAAGGLLVALPLDRLLLRHWSTPAFFLTAALAGTGASIVAEKLIFYGPFASFGALVLPALAASMAAATFWWATVRKRETSIHA